MTDSNNSPPDTASRRRSSFAGQTFADLFGAGRTRASAGSDAANNSPPTGSITSAAAQAQRRKMSLNTVGLSGSPNQPSTLNKFGRRDSISSANSGSIDESAVEDDNAGGVTQPTPSTPFGRRMSFGARALRDVKTNSNNGGGGTGGGGGGSADKSNGDGYNWADNFRSRAERSSSIVSTGSAGSPLMGNHVRAKSMATMQPPAREMPKPNVPDHFQERILKGDFYMD